MSPPMLATVMRGVLGASGMPLSINGRKQALLVNVANALGVRGPETLDTRYGALRLDPSHRPERLLGLAFDNILHDYLSSDLYRYLAALDKAAGDVFVDIGANLGFYSLLARHHGFDTALFEPEPHHAAFLKRNPERYGRVFEVALSDAPGEAVFHVADAKNSGASSLVDHPGIYADAIRVPLDTFSRIAATPEFPRGRVRLIKIDVEGAEVGTVRGMEAWLATGPRPHLWIEVRGGASTRATDTWRDVTAALAPFGYRAHEWKDGKPVAVAASQTFADRGIFDLIFIPS